MNPMMAGLVLGCCLLRAGTAQTVRSSEPPIPSVAPDLSTQRLAPGAKELPVGFATMDSVTLPGTVTLPAPGPMLPTTVGEAARPAPRPPIAVLVQGSGVQDRDATLGPNKFFEQLAWGLAARGVATLRYDRRARISPASFAEHPDLDHEVVSDAASALDFVSTLPEVDERRVFLVGHSLGAQLAPDIVALRLVQLPGSVRGVVLLSGIARPIDQVIDEQVHALGRNQGGTPEQIDAQAKRWAEVFAQARNPGTPIDQPLGVGTKLPARYWRDWLRRDPVAAIKTLRVPVLVTRGTKDLNAPHSDFVLLAAASNVGGSGAREFSGLNHLYMPLAGEPNGTDVLQPGQVSSEFLDYLAGWLLRTGAPLSEVLAEEQMQP